MTEERTPRDRLRELADRLHLPFEELLGDLLTAAPPEAPAAAPVTPPSLYLSEAAIHAAISDSFVAGEIEENDPDREILAQSEVIMIGGRRRLRLSDAARGAILRDASGDERFGARLAQAIASDNATPAAAKDEVEARSACLRRFISGAPNDLSSASPAELRPAVAALERLRAAPLAPAVPSLAETQRLLERAELLEPLRISIGATGEWAGAPTADRFVGREAQLRTLRSFVDEIASEGAIESIQRGAVYVGQAVRRQLGDDKVQGIRCLIARGGLGKSALIAKFVLDHALRQTRQFPFAYLDFDRAAIQARDPRLLLVEVARQVALQFPTVAQDLAALRQRIRQSISDTGSTSRPDVDPFDDFRALVSERVTGGERALLIVLDTVEIVQCDSLGLKGLLDFLERLSRGGFTELRLVAAARAAVPELIAGSASRHPGVLLTLEPLSEGEAREMVQRLGRSLLPSAWKDEWTARVAGKKSDPPVRREPLSLRVAVETIRDAVPQDRDSLSHQIAALGEDAADSFVGKLYATRVVGHVAGGEEVRKLAWPGLVVRRVSVEVIRDLLAPLLSIEPSHAQTLFDTLATQVWIVARDGNVLRHQPDLRARTLPFMRRKPEFKKINTAAIAYFGSRGASSAQDRAEWLYHRLLGDESPASVDADWGDSLIPFLKDAQDDFPPRSAASDYLAARTADRPLPDELLLRVDPALALLHIARTGLEKGHLTDRKIDPLLVALRLVPPPPSPLPPSAAAARVSLLVKTGRWTDVDERLPDIKGPWQHQAATALAFRRARMIPQGRESDAETQIAAAYAPRAFERASPASLIQDLAATRIHSFPLDAQLDDMLTRLLSRGVSPNDATLGLPMLRTAMLFGYQASVPAARLWIAQVIEQLRASEQLAVSARELHALAGDDELESVARKALEGTGQEWEEFLALRSSPSVRKRLEDPMLGPAVCDALRRRCERGEPDDLQALRMFAAARDEDWLTPLAYAAHRATGGEVPKKMADLYETHRPVARGYLRRNVLSRVPVPTDILEALRRADEASDVAGAARLFVEHGEPANVGDLQALCEWYSAWRAGVQRVLAPPPGPPRVA